MSFKGKLKPCKEARLRAENLINSKINHTISVSWCSKNVLTQVKRPCFFRGSLIKEGTLVTCMFFKSLTQVPSNRYPFVQTKNPKYSAVHPGTLTAGENGGLEDDFPFQLDDFWVSCCL